MTPPAAPLPSTAVPWISGTIKEVFEQGWNAAAIPDDGVTRWSFSQPVNMISAIVGLSQASYSYGYTDYELDAVMQVPEPASVVLAGLAAASLLASRRRRKRLNC